MPRKKNLNPTVDELTDKQNKIKERIEFLDIIVNDIKKTGNVPLVPFGGIINDLFLLNPEYIKIVIPDVLKLYQKEKKDIESGIIEIEKNNL